VSQASLRLVFWAITYRSVSLHVCLHTDLPHLLRPIDTTLLLSDAALFFLGEQVTGIIKFFLSRNLRIARERAYAQTVASRGKPENWWGPYVEERIRPPRINTTSQSSWSIDRLLSTFVGRLILKNVILAPFSFVPMVGVLVSAWVRALGTARFLHRPVSYTCNQYHKQ
jgi:hypothetical protein